MFPKLSSPRSASPHRQLLANLATQVLILEHRDMQELYKKAWEELRLLRESCADIEPECTPVLAFGRWETARVVTAGLNPSEDEFRDKNHKTTAGMKAPLEPSRQRFLHWENGELTANRITEAFRRSDRYFELGNAYSQWFEKYTPFLEFVGASFEEGTACHTDYVSPFATKCGISKCNPDTQRQLPLTGEEYWLDVLNCCPCVEIVFGHGPGWHQIPKLFNTSWEELQTRFDQKGGEIWEGKAHLLFAKARLLVSGRQLAIYWWKPNRDGSPLCYLTAEEKKLLGEQIASHYARCAS
ncbi:MAG: hypothetical protein ABSD28_12830 [Tepidisphaeraceae bacterium]|jgi:hypothetical protein